MKAENKIDSLLTRTIYLQGNGDKEYLLQQTNNKQTKHRYKAFWGDPMHENSRVL